jgi:hypothetical protein
MRRKTRGAPTKLPFPPLAGKSSQRFQAWAGPTSAPRQHPRWGAIGSPFWCHQSVCTGAGHQANSTGDPEFLGVGTRSEPAPLLLPRRFCSRLSDRQLSSLFPVRKALHKTRSGYACRPRIFARAGEHVRAAHSAMFHIAHPFGLKLGDYSIEELLSCF